MKVHQTIIYQSLNFPTSSTENLHGVRNIGLGNCLLAADPFEVEIRCMRSLDPMGARKVPSFPSPAAA